MAVATTKHYDNQQSPIWIIWVYSLAVIIKIDFWTVCTCAKLYIREAATGIIVAMLK